MVREVLAAENPTGFFAEVTAVDWEDAIAQVRLPGQQSTFPVPTGGVRPQVGAVVRLGGQPGRYHVISIVGEADVWSKTEVPDRHVRGWVPWMTLTSASPAQAWLDGTEGEPIPEPGFTKIRFAGRFSTSTYAWATVVFDLHASYFNNAQAYDFTGDPSGGLNDAARSSIWFGYLAPSVSSHVEATIHRVHTSTPYLVSESQIRAGLNNAGAVHQRVHAHGAASLSTPFTVMSFGTNTGSISTLELEFELYYP